MWELMYVWGGVREIAELAGNARLFFKVRDGGGVGSVPDLFKGSSFLAIVLALL